jgi:cytochrome b561
LTPAGLDLDNPERENWYNVHKSIGLTILGLAIVRLVWRWANPPPPLPGTLGYLERFAALLSHWRLYAALIFMPASGYLFSAVGNHPVNWFGLFTVPNIVPYSAALAHFGGALHLAGQWALYDLIILHVIATIWHIVVRRDGALDRTLSAQNANATKEAEVSRGRAKNVFDTATRRAAPSLDVLTG